MSIKGNLSIMNDSMTAKLLVEEIKGKYLYLHEYNHWLVYSNGVWQEDKETTIFKTTDNFLVKLATESEGKGDLDLYKFYHSCRNHTRLNAIVKAAKQLELNVSISKFNQDLSLVNLKNGTYDTKLRVFRKHRHDDYLTCQFNCNYNPNAKSKIWDDFIDRVDTSGDDCFLQKATGSNLVGKNTEEKLYVIYGPTRTGKSTFTETILNIFGSYGKKADSSTFLDTRTDGIRNDIARLKDARMVVSNELKKGVKLDACLIKSLTGNDKITVRHLYGEYFEYDVTYNIWLATNYFPKIDTTDKAAWRRIIAIPFKTAFKEPDPTIKERFFHDEETKSAILNWVIYGYHLYQAKGLESPESIKISNNECKLSQCEVIGLMEFINDCCEIGEGWEATRSYFYKSYLEYCLSREIPFEGKKAIFSAMLDSGFKVKQASKGVNKNKEIIEGITVMVGAVMDNDADDIREQVN